MLPRHHTAGLSFPIWCLLFSWVCFGGLDLLEQLKLMPEVEDQDEVALSQLASGLKSEDSSHDVTYDTSLAEAVTGPAVRVFIHPVQQFIRLIVHSPPSLRLHQQLSVYRI
ncbi:MAG: hypothetical protein E8D41_11560 [Nitrospira sp.]|nr:MAG: hypothetical protein E8D41_11560 [Nitrospira sp.]